MARDGVSTAGLVVPAIPAPLLSGVPLRGNRVPVVLDPWQFAAEPRPQGDVGGEAGEGEGGQEAAPKRRRVSGARRMQAGRADGEGPSGSRPAALVAAAAPSRAKGKGAAGALSLLRDVHAMRAAAERLLAHADLDPDVRLLALGQLEELT